ncbi:MAG: transglycosylase SLT domain-containing protein [Quisquiliibacterium sp.]
MLIRHWTGLWSERLKARLSVLRHTKLLAMMCGLSLALILGSSMHQVDESGMVASPFSADVGKRGASWLGTVAMAPDSFGLRMPSTRWTPSSGVEQQHIARFIAQRYNLAFEQTQFFVENAYRTAREFRLDPWLILAVISIESSFNPLAESNKGAQGLMQVLTRVHAEKFKPFGGVHAAFDPVANIRVGAQILKEYIGRAGSIEGALKYYVGAAQLPTDGGYGAKVLDERDRIAAAARTGVAGPAELRRRAQAENAAPGQREKSLPI